VRRLRRANGIKPKRRRRAKNTTNEDLVSLKKA